jgi:hypothetical protein
VALVTPPGLPIEVGLFGASKGMEAAIFFPNQKTLDSVQFHRDGEAHCPGS